MGRQSICWPPLASSCPPADHTDPALATSPSRATGELHSASSQGVSGARPWNRAVTSRLACRRPGRSSRRARRRAIPTCPRGAEHGRRRRTGRRGVPRHIAIPGPKARVAGLACLPVRARQPRKRPLLEVVPERVIGPPLLSGHELVHVREVVGRRTPGIGAASRSSPSTSPTTQACASRIGVPAWVIDTAIDAARREPSNRADLEVDGIEVGHAEVVARERGRASQRCMRTGSSERDDGEVAAVRPPDLPVPRRAEPGTGRPSPRSQCPPPGRPRPHPHPERRPGAGIYRSSVSSRTTAARRVALAFVRRSTSRGARPIRSVKRVPSLASSSTGTTLDTNPSAFASCASTTRPVKHSSRASPPPTMSCSGP